MGEERMVEKEDDLFKMLFKASQGCLKLFVVLPTRRFHDPLQQLTLTAVHAVMFVFWPTRLGVVVH